MTKKACSVTHAFNVQPIICEAASVPTKIALNKRHNRLGIISASPAVDHFQVLEMSHGSLIQVCYNARLKPCLRSLRTFRL